LTEGLKGQTEKKERDNSWKAADKGTKRRHKREFSKHTAGKRYPHGDEWWGTQQNHEIHEVATTVKKKNGHKRTVDAKARVTKNPRTNSVGPTKRRRPMKEKRQAPGPTQHERGRGVTQKRNGTDQGAEDLAAGFNTFTLGE